LKKKEKQFNSIAGILEARENLYEIKNDQGCAILENEINGEENHYMVCINVRKPKTDDKTLKKQIKTFNYSAKRTAISSHYGVVIRKIIHDSYMIARKFIKENILPVSHKMVEKIRVSNDLKASDFFNVTVSDDGLFSANGLAVKFDDVDSCDVYYNPLFIKDKTIYNGKRSCCFRFQFRAVFEYACLNTFDCEYNTLAVARDFYEKCLVKKARKRAEDILYNELHTGKHFKALDYIRILFQLEKLNVIDLANVNTNLSSVEFHSKFRAVIIKHLFEMKKFFHKANMIDVQSAVKVVKDPNAAPVEGLAALYTGKSKDFSIVVAKGLKGSSDKKTVNIYESTDKKKLTVIDYARYTKTDEFVAVSVERKSEPSYFLMIFEDSGKRFYYEMYNNGKNTLTVDPINLTVKTDEIKKNLKIGLDYDF